MREQSFDCAKGRSEPEGGGRERRLSLSWDQLCKRENLQQVRPSGQCVEESRFTDIGKADDAASKSAHREKGNAKEVKTEDFACASSAVRTAQEGRGFFKLFLEDEGDRKSVV